MCPTRSRLPGWRHARGFTLIELIMVMVLVGILAVVVIPRLDVRVFNDVGYRDKARGALEFARKAAVAERRNVQVSLAGNNLTFRVANDVPEGANAVNFAVASSRALALPVPDQACGGATNQVCAPSGVTLAGPATLTFSALGQASVAAVYNVTGTTAFTITIEAETGLVH